MTPDDPRHGTYAGTKAHQSAGQEACFACRVARANYWTHAHREQAYGRWNPWTPAAPVRDHVRALMADGMSIKRIAETIGVRPTRISYLLYGRGVRELPTKVRPDFAEAVLSVHAKPRLVPIYRASRRLRALIALGYAQTTLGRRLNISQGRVWQYVIEAQEHITEDTFAAIDALYNELSMTLPPRTTKAEKHAASKALNTAKRHGYAPPLAWNNIDDPAEHPHGHRRHDTTDGTKGEVDPVIVDRLLAGVRISHTVAERREVVARLWHLGMGAESIAKRCGLEKHNVDQDIRRLGFKRGAA